MISLRSATEEPSVRRPNEGVDLGRLRVVQVMGGNEEGGLELHLVQLSNALASSGTDVSVIAQAKYAKRFHGNIRFHALDLARSRNSPAILWQLAKRIRDEQPHIVHAQANKASAMVARIAPWLPGYRIATVHSQKRNTRMYRRMHAVIGVSSGVLESVECQNTRVIYNGTEPALRGQLRREDLGTRFALRSDVPITLAVGRLVPVKGFDRLINAWRPVFGELLIVGDGCERSRLESLVHSRDLANCVRFAGHQKDARSLMTGADLLVISSHREGFSYVLGEALLARLPVLSTRVAGADETLPDAQLVDHSSVALAEALEDCLDNLGVVRERMAPVFEWAERELTVERMAEKTLQLYRDVLEPV